MAENDRMQINFPQALQMLQQERASLEAIEIRLSNFSRILEETLMVKETLVAMQTLDDLHIIMSIGAGVYANVTLENTEKVKVTLGGGILKDDTLDNALKGLSNRQKEAETEIAKLQEERQKIVTNLNSLNTVARQLAPRNPQ
ncbi:MAG: hypothetical protein Q7R47_02560 [Candidatus Diapherotrites archaeon]|nr:hypothetical protein [Candidatus Diapherotrites archaeon]